MYGTTACSRCNSMHRGGDCPAHSTLMELDPEAGVDQASLAYTQLPVPAELTVKPSGIPGAGLGVFANKFIPRNMKMGPYEGKRVEMGEVANTAYAWEVINCPLYCVELTQSHQNSGDV